jgi:beta-lactamase regulating signal transducer with metallopeptidase domain
MIAGLLDHIWQSTLFAAGIGGFTLWFRRNGAAVRFWLWFAASVKFLLPFAVLAMAGAYLSRLFPAPLPQSLLAFQPAAAKFSAPVQMLAGKSIDPPQGLNLAPLLLAVWLLGLCIILAVRLLHWSRLRAVTAAAQQLALPAKDTPVPILASDSLLEPGLVGIVKPVILLPLGLMARLSRAEQESILAHEFSHLRRRDNVTAAFHMVVEALFWFYPPVWLIGSRLVAERERACDETVLASGHDPEVYAGGILKVCKFCIQSPLACAPGASGADLKRRVREIMTAPAAVDLSAAKRMLLAGAATLVLIPPIIAGFSNMPLAVTVTRNMIAVQAEAEQAVTAVVEQIGMAPVARVTVGRLPPLKIKLAATLPALPPAEDMPVPPGNSAVPEAAPAPLTMPTAPAEVVSPAEAPAATQALLALNPTGKGDPDDVTCRVPQPLPGSRFAGPQICRTNRVWAALRANRQDISPDGKTIVYLDDIQRQKAGYTNCRSAFFTRAGAANLFGPSSTYCF